jgi:hypothetical protein
LQSVDFLLMRKKVQLELMGGIGNQLFIYAAGKWLTRKFGYTVSFDARLLSIQKAHEGFITDLNISGSVDTLNGKWAIGRLVASVERLIRKQVSSLDTEAWGKVFRPKIYVGAHDFDPSSIAKNQYKYVSAYFQTYLYSAEIFNELKLEYQLKSESGWLVEKRALARKLSVLAIHIRRGDYVSLKDSFGLLSQDYYLNSIKALRGNGFQWEEIWVFSDDVVAAKNLISEVLAEENVTYIEPPEGTNPIESLILFSEASFGIIANSTFSWWACFLSRSMKAVVAPRSWFKSVPDPKDLIPESWFRVQSDWQQ